MLRFRTYASALSLFVVVLLVPLARMTPRLAAPARPAMSVSQASAPVHHNDSANARTLMNRLPARFEWNDGQAGDDVAFIARAHGHQLLLSCDEAVLAPAQGDRAAVRMRMEGAQRCAPAGEHRLRGTTNYFTGNDPAEWRTNVPSFERARFNGVYPGIDLVYYGTGEHLEYDFVVSPGASANAIELSFEGVTSIRVADNGDLVLVTDAGELRQHAPRVYQTVDGAQRRVEGRYAVTSERRVRFEIGDYDTSLAVVIDPILVYSTYFGGYGSESFTAIASSADGSIYVTGFTKTRTFPTKNAFQSAKAGTDSTDDVFVAKINAAGTELIYSTYFGGASYDTVGGIAVDSQGAAYLVGYTYSADFPSVSGSYTLGAATSSGIFVVKLSPAGTSLGYVTRLALYAASTVGNSYGAIALDSAGNAYVTGQTTTAGLPVVNGASTYCNGSGALSFVCSDDAYVVKFNAAGTGIAYSTYLGGSGSDSPRAIAVDASGVAFVAGSTMSPDFPVTDAFQSTPQGSFDAFVTAITPEGDAFLISTFLGGSNGDSAEGVAVFTDGTVAVTGQTLSSNFPLRNAAQPSMSGGVDAFVTTFRGALQELVFSTFVGGPTNVDIGLDVGFDARGRVHVVGTTTGTTLTSTLPQLRNFPVGVEGAGGYDDLFTVTYNPDGTLIHAMRVGTNTVDRGRAGAVSPNGDIVMLGETGSSTFPVFSPLQSANAGAPAGSVAQEGVILRFVTALSISSVSPTVVGLTGGETVRVLGMNFDAAASVRLDGVPVTTRYVNPTELIVTVPARSSGLATVTVVNPDGETAALTSALRFLGCTFALSMADISFGAGGGIGVVDVFNAENVCSWTATSTGSWVRFIGPSTGQGNGRVQCSIDPNGTSAGRTAVMKIGGRELVIRQAAAGQFMRTAGDVTGDGLADLTLFRSTDAMWTTQHVTSVGFGSRGDLAVPADYNGDGLTDRAVFRPSTGAWLVEGAAPVTWGRPGDVPAPADYNGDGAADVAVFRPSTGTWYVRNQFVFDWGRTGDLAVPADYNGDGLADIAVFRPSTGRWWIAGVGAFDWGVAGDIPVPADYNGDWIIDIAVYRPSTGIWYVRNQFSMQYGLPGDVPVPLDVDGDRHANIAVYRPSDAVWFVEGRGAGIALGQPGDVPAMFRFDVQLRAARDLDRDRRSDLILSEGANWTLVRSAGNSWGASSLWFGLDTDIRRVADFDGDGRGDLALFRPSTGFWYVALSSTGFSTFTSSGPWGTTGDAALPADYDGDGRADYAVYRPSLGRWYIQRSSDAVNMTLDWGLPGDVAAPGDYDGDGRIDPAVFRPSAGRWYVRKSSDDGMLVFDWGLSDDVPVPADYDGDGRADIAVFRPSTGAWWIKYSTTEYVTYATTTYGGDSDIPVPGDYNGDGFDEPAYFRPNVGVFTQTLGQIYVAAPGLTAISDR